MNIMISKTYVMLCALWLTCAHALSVSSAAQHHDGVEDPDASVGEVAKHEAVAAAHQAPEVYITGFGPFGSVDDNPTMHLIDYFKEHGVCGVDNVQWVKRGDHVLHVSVERGGAQLEFLHDASTRNLHKRKHQIWLHLGVYSGERQLRLESVAQNCMDFSIPDECGYQPRKEPITEGEEDLLCQLPLDTIYAKMQEEFPDLCKISTNAGKYLCNYVYFKGLEWCKENPEKRCALFVHVPEFREVCEEKQKEFIEKLLKIMIAECGNCNDAGRIGGDVVDVAPEPYNCILL